MKKILHLLSSADYSGAEKVVITIIHWMNKMYPGEYEFCYLSPSGTIDEVLKENKIRHIVISQGSFSSLKKIIRDENPDLIHAHDFKASIMASFFAKKVCVISHLHNNPQWIMKRGLRSVLYSFTLKQYTRILLVSEAIRNEYIYAAGFKGKEVVIGNPIVSDPWKEVPRDIDILFAGRITKQKNPLRFLEICRSFPEDTNCVMIGRGELEKECSDYIEKNNLQNVHLLGFKKNSIDYMRRAKVLLITSDWEGYGLVAFEALSAGTPVVSTGVGGLSGIVTGDCGILYYNNEEAVSEIKNLLTDHSYWKNKSLKAVERAKALENIAEYCNKLHEIYSEAFNNCIKRD